MQPRASSNGGRRFASDALRFAVGIEDTFVPQTSEGQRALDEYELTCHYERFHNDLALARDCGATMIRYGIPWYRINPAPDVFEWEWLDRVVARLVELGLEPIVDLVHYGTPLWLEGTFLNPDYARRVSDYAARVAERYHDSISLYTPLNEPLINAAYCGDWGIWPPNAEGHHGFVSLIHAICRGIVETQAAVASVVADAAFVHVEASIRYVGALDQEDAQLLLARRFVAEDLVCGRVDNAHPLSRYLLENGMSDADLAWFASSPSPPDIMGVNYYPNLSTEIFLSDAAHHGAPWDPRPRRDDDVNGLEDVIRLWHERYKVPIFVTETCHPGSDVARRLRWLDDSVAAVLRLRDQGIPIVGYTWWPLFDMVDWRYREGAEPVESFLLPSGLYSLAGDDDLARRPTALVERFRQYAVASATLAAPIDA